MTNLPEKYRLRLEGLKATKTPTECWHWSIGPYPTVVIGVKRKLVHRISCEYFNGPFADELQVDHLCKNPKCVNPSHLEAVTAQVNQLRSNSRSAINAKKTHCPQGHPLSGDNLYYYTPGRSRMCRSCIRVRSSEYGRAKRRRK